MSKQAHTWLRTARIFALESWWPPFWPHLEVDWDRALWTMQRLHLDTLQANALTKWACYPTNLVKRHPELGVRDLLQEAQVFCRKHGFRWIAYSLLGHALPLSTQLSKPVLALHRPLLPDTSRVVEEGHRLTIPAEFQTYPTHFHFGGERYLPYCPFAAEAWLVALVGEVADRYDYDGAWLDTTLGPGGGSVCICPTCQQAYEAEFRRPLPLIEDRRDPRLVGLRRWVMRRQEVLLGKVVDRFTKQRAVPVVGKNLEWAAFYPPVLRHLDAIMYERTPDELDLVRKTSEGRSALPAYLVYPDCFDPWPRLVTSGWEVEANGLTILGLGGTPYLAQPGKYYYDDTNDEPARRVLAFMEAHTALLADQEPDTYCAVASPPAFAPPEAQAAQQTAARGWTSALLDAHVPVSGLLGFRVDDGDTLRRYRVVIAEQAAVLSDQALEALHAFVAGGGGLHLGADVGGLDDRLQRRDGGLLRELFDLHRSEPSRDALLRWHQFVYRQTYEVYLRIAGDGTKGDEGVGGKQGSGGVPLPGPKVQPAYVGQTRPGPSWTVLANLVPTDEPAPLAPALACKLLGRGRIVFSPVGWGRQYLERQDPALASWMSDLVSWLAGAAPPVQVAGSPLLHCSSTAGAQGRLLYLVNTSNGLPSRGDGPRLMRVAQRPLPIGPVEIVVPGAARVEAIYGPPPDRVVDDAGAIKAVYDRFADHVVLHVR